LNNYGKTFSIWDSRKLPDSSTKLINLKSSRNKLRNY